MNRTTRTSRQELPRRERQVMDIVYAGGKVSASDVQAQLPDHPTYSATRMLMQRLHKKGLVQVEMDGPRYIYSPSTPRFTAGKAAFARLVKTFFDGSRVNAFNALLGASSDELTDAELAELERLVANAKAKRSRERSE